MYGAGTSPSTDEILMMRPRPCARMCGRTAFVMRMSAKTLMSKTRWPGATELSSAAPAAPVPAAAARVGGDHALVGVDQQQQRQAEDQLHARPPEVVELVLEHPQGVLDELVSPPAEPHVQQVQAERTAEGLPHVQ